MAFYVKTTIVFEGNSFLKIKSPLSSNKSLLAKKYFFLLKRNIKNWKWMKITRKKINPWKQKISCKVQCLLNILNYLRKLFLCMAITPAEIRCPEDVWPQAVTVHFIATTVNREYMIWHYCCWQFNVCRHHRTYTYM